MFVPCAVTVNAGEPPEPAAAEFGVIELNVGLGKPPVGVERVSGNEADEPSEFETDTCAVPGKTASLYGMDAVSCVMLTTVVVIDCEDPFQFTNASLVKFVPFTVSVKP
jgi:hypothetical protein